MGFKDMKSASKNAYQTLASEMDKMAKKSESYKDDRLWRAETDKTGNGYAEIRFLPAPDGEDLPWARVWHHGFRGPGGWYIENSLTTIGLKDPVSEMNSMLWNTGSDKDKAIARDRKRKLSYISNILVVSDPANRDNEGKVFLFKYGKKIFDKLQEAMNPSDPDEPKFNPFDFWKGANFKLKAHMDSGYVSYEKSGFSAPAPLFEGDDAKLEALWKKEYALKEFVAEDQFKSYEELSTRFSQVMKVSSAASVKAEDAEPEDFRTKMGKANQVAESASKKAPVKKIVDDDDESEALSYFRKLAEDDE